MYQSLDNKSKDEIRDIGVEYKLTFQELKQLTDNAFKKDINAKKNKSILKKLIQTKKVRSKIIKLKQDINKPDFGRS